MSKHKKYCKCLRKAITVYGYGFGPKSHAYRANNAQQVATPRGKLGGKLGTGKTGDRPPGKTGHRPRFSEGKPGVAVGTEVALCPPHRSVQAGLPHPAPASGNDAKRTCARRSRRAASRTASRPIDTRPRLCVRCAENWEDRKLGTQKTGDRPRFSYFHVRLTT